MGRVRIKSLLEYILHVSRRTVSLLNACEVHKMRRPMYLVIEVLWVRQHQLVLHVRIVPHT